VDLTAERYAPLTYWAFFSNNTKNSISDIRDIKRWIMACRWNLS